MNSVIKAIKERRSIRAFKPDMPPKEDIEQIVEAGLYAPNGMGLQETITIAITNKELRDKLAADNAAVMGKDASVDPFYGAPVILVVLANKDRLTHMNDGSLVIGTMLLAAYSLGLGGIWIHRAKEEFEQPFYQELLREHGIEGNWEGIGHCAIGYMDGDLPQPAPRKDGRVLWFE